MNQVVFVLTLDAGTNNIAEFKNAVFSFNERLYFHLMNDAQKGIITSLNDFVSTFYITISTPIYTLNENLP